MQQTESYSTKFAKLRAEHNGLQTRFGDLLAENNILQQENEALRAKHASLLHQLNEVTRLIYGTKSERFVPDASPNGHCVSGCGRARTGGTRAPDGPDTTKGARSKQRPSRQLLPAHLPREVITLEPEGDVSSLKQIGIEVTLALHYVPGTLVVMRRERVTYIDPRKENGGFLMADLPPRLIDKSLAEC